MAKVSNPNHLISFIVRKYNFEQRLNWLSCHLLARLLSNNFSITALAASQVR